MTEPELRRVIIGPAAAAGLEIETGLIDTILGDLRSRTPGSGDTGTLPLLSQALHVTHRHSDGAGLTVRGYGFSGGVTRAVARSAEAAYADLSAAEQAAAVDLFQTLTALAPDGAVTRRRVPLADLRAHRSIRSASGTVDSVVERLTDARLLVRDQDSVEIAHDVLLTAWPRLGEWLADDHAGRVLYFDLVRQAGRWQQHGRDPSFCYRGAELAAATALLTRWQGEPGRYPQPEPTTTAFLSTSARGQTRRRRALITAVATVLLISSSLTGVALRQRQAALDQQASAGRPRPDRASRGTAQQRHPHCAPARHRGRPHPVHRGDPQQPLHHPGQHPTRRHDDRPARPHRGGIRPGRANSGHRQPTRHRRGLAP